MNPITYKWLFAYLRNLGYSDSSPSKFERVFEHRKLGILLAVSMLDDATEDRVARDADILSVQFQLQQHGLLEGNLVDVPLSASLNFESDNETNCDLSGCMNAD